MVFFSSSVGAHQQAAILWKFVVLSSPVGAPEELVVPPCDPYTVVEDLPNASDPQIGIPVLSLRSSSEKRLEVLVCACRKGATLTGAELRVTLPPISRSPRPILTGERYAQKVVRPSREVSDDSVADLGFRWHGKEP